jgi:hypothetical protein
MSAPRRARPAHAASTAALAALAALLLAGGCRARSAAEDSAAGTAADTTGTATSTADTPGANAAVPPDSAANRDTAAPPRDPGAGAPPGPPGGRTPPPPPPPPPPSPTPADTARGTIAVVGSAPFSKVVLQPPGEAHALTLTGPDTAALRRLGGLDVMVRGTARPGGTFEVRAFTVRATDGQPVLDGTLVRDGAGLAVRTAAGLVRLGNPPAALRALVGARVWVGGPPATGPNQYGVITAAR